MDNIIERIDDFAGLVTGIRMDHHQRIPQQALYWQDTRGDQVVRERTGGPQSAKTYERWGSPGRKQRWQLLTDTVTDDVGVWPQCVKLDAGWIKVKVKTATVKLS